MAPGLFAPEVAKGLWKYVSNGSLQRVDTTGGPRSPK
jgi:hypothetical protein